MAKRTNIRMTGVVLVVLGAFGLIAWMFLLGTIGFGAVLFVLVPAIVAVVAGAILIAAYR